MVKTSTGGNGKHVGGSEKEQQVANTNVKGAAGDNMYIDCPGVAIFSKKRIWLPWVRVCAGFM